MDNYTGKRLDGRYEIQEVIGVGGMAVVYKAYDNIDDRIVAVKILKDEFLANEEFRRRFKNESKAISLLSHPNIVKVFNVNYGDRLQYIVMEYVEGITLKEYIEQQGKLGIKETVHFTMQILRALQHAVDLGGDEARAVQQRRGVHLHNAQRVQHQDPALLGPGGFKGGLVHSRRVKSDQSIAEFLSEGIGDSLVVAGALGKQIFAHQLDQREADDAERHDDDQQIGDGDLPAYGMYEGFNPCQ